MGGTEGAKTLSARDRSSGTAGVALVTVSYRSQDVLKPMLASARQASARPIAGIVADNHPDPVVAKLAEKAAFGYLPLHNNGYGSAVNAAVATLPASIEWVVISNPDVVFETDAIDRLLQVAESDPAIAAVGPRIYDENGSIYPSARAIPSLRMGIGHAVLGRVWPDNPWTRRYLQSVDLESDARRDTGWLSGACLLVRRSAFAQVGGFDEAFFMYFEDVDLGFRLGKAGFRNVYAPTARISHVGGTSTDGESARMSDAHHESARIFVGHKYPGPILAPLRLVIGLGLRVRARLTRNPGTRI